jgi:hypothetical protein
LLHALHPEPLLLLLQQLQMSLLLPVVVVLLLGHSLAASCAAMQCLLGRLVLPGPPHVCVAAPGPPAVCGA